MSTEPNSESPADETNAATDRQTGTAPPTIPVPDATSINATERFKNEVAVRKQADLDAHYDEETLWSGGYTPKAMFGSWLVMAVLTIVLLVVPFFVSQLSWGIALGLIALIWVVGGGVYGYRRLGYHYELTSQRFIHQTGLLSRKTDRIEVIDIDDVSFTQGPVQRIFGVGNIELTGSDRTHPQLSMLGIAKVKEVSGLIDDTRRKERRRRSLHIESI